MRIWDSVTLNTLHVIGTGFFDRAVTCIAFSKSVSLSPAGGTLSPQGGVSSWPKRERVPLGWLLPASPSPPSEATLLRAAFHPWGEQRGGPAAAVLWFCRPLACSGLECHPLPRGPQHAPAVLTGWFTVTGLDDARVSPRPSLSTMSSSRSETMSKAHACVHTHAAHASPQCSPSWHSLSGTPLARSVLCRGRARQP